MNARALKVLGVVRTDATFTRQTVRGEELWVGRCIFCDARLVVALDGRCGPEVSIEHITPRNHGGDDSPQNLALGCAGCNQEKGRRHDARSKSDARRQEVEAVLHAKRQARWRELG